MRRSAGLVPLLFLATLLSCFVPPAGSEGPLPERIDRTNWEQAQGLLPESVLNWVRQGDWVLQTKGLHFDPNGFVAAFAEKAFRENRDRYGLDPNGGLVEKETGKAPGVVVGLPFPHIDPADPEAALKIMYNNHYMQYLLGDIRVNVNLLWVGPSGFEREVGCEWIQAAMTGWPGAKGRRNRLEIEKYATLLVRSPFDAAGLAVMLWRYQRPDKMDSTFVYIPALRKVRRVSPANRSDAIGSDACADDANGHDGKLSNFEWRLVEQRDALVPWHDTQPIRLVRNGEGEWETTKMAKRISYGYGDKGWKGAPWAAENLVWAKRPMYVLEARPKDPNYNYSAQFLWIDRETFSCNYKIIHDRSGRYWKTFLKADSPCQGPDQEIRLLSVGTQIVVDDRKDHATIIEGIGPRNIWVYFARLELNDFSLGGFQKLCK